MFKKWLPGIISAIITVSLCAFYVNSHPVVIQNVGGGSGTVDRLPGITTPGHGGTGTSTVFTQGSVVFAGASGIYTQDNANFFFDDTNNRLGLLTAVPTHTLTLGSTATGAVFYNTSDQTVNYERVHEFWSSNVYTLSSEQGGTGIARNFNITGGNVGINSTAPGSVLTVEENSLGGTAGADSTSVKLQNLTAAAAGVQQVSPALIFSGNGWGTTTPASANVSWRIMNLPVQSTANPTSTLQFQSSIAGAGYITPLSISSAGTLIVSPAASTSVTIQTNQTATSSNFVVISTGMASQSIAQLIYGGAATTMVRGYMRGSTNTIAGVSSSVANFVIGTETFTTAASGTHPWASSLVLKPLTITIGTATVTNSATLYLEGPATGATNNYTLFAAAGLSSFSGLGTAIVTKTTTYTITASDSTIRCDATSGSFTATLPTAASTFANGEGQIFTFKKIDVSANTCTLKGNGAETIDGTNTKVISTQYQDYQVQSNGTSWDIL